MRYGVAPNVGLDPICIGASSEFVAHERGGLRTERTDSTDTYVLWHVTKAAKSRAIREKGTEWAMAVGADAWKALYASCQAEQAAKAKGAIEEVVSKTVTSGVM